MPKCVKHTMAVRDGANWKCDINPADPPPDMKCPPNNKTVFKNNAFMCGPDPNNAPQMKCPPNQKAVIYDNKWQCGPDRNNPPRAQKCPRGKSFGIHGNTWRCG